MHPCQGNWVEIGCAVVYCAGPPTHLVQEFNVGIVDGIALTLLMLENFCPKHKDAKIFEKHLNPVMLVFIG